MTSSLMDALQIFSADMLKPLFDALAGGLNDNLGKVFDVAAGKLSSSFSGIVQAGQDVFAALGLTARATLDGIVTGLQSMSAWLSENRARVAAFAAAIVGVVTAAGGAFGNLAAAIARITAAGLGPLTATLNVLSTVLSSTSAQLAIAALAFGRFVSYAASGAGVIVRLVDVCRNLPVVLASGVSHTQAFTGAISAGINPWLAFGLAVTAAAVALEYFAGARRRAAQEQERAIAKAAADTESFRRSLDEVLELERKAGDPGATAGDRSGFITALNAQLQAMKHSFPEIADLIDQVTEAERTLQDAAEEATRRRVTDVDRRIAKAHQEMETLTAQNAALRDSATHAADVMDATLGAPDWSEVGKQLDSINRRIRENNELLEAAHKRMATLQHEKVVLATPAAAPPTPEPLKTAPHGKDTSREQLQAFRDQLEQKKALEENWFTWTRPASWSSGSRS